jgi:hypothetical protein
MNILSIIRNSIQKEQKLLAAQFLMAKAYRGVPYVEAPTEQPHSGSCTYRGVNYTL